MLTLDGLIKKLKRINKKYAGDREEIHIAADDALLEYINSKEVTELFRAIEKWYA